MFYARVYLCLHVCTVAQIAPHKLHNQCVIYTGANTYTQSMNHIKEYNTSPSPKQAQCHFHWQVTLPGGRAKVGDWHRVCVSVCTLVSKSTSLYRTLYTPSAKHIHWLQTHDSFISLVLKSQHCNKSKVGFSTKGKTYFPKCFLPRTQTKYAHMCRHTTQHIFNKNILLFGASTYWWDIIIS